MLARLRSQVEEGRGAPPPAEKPGGDKTRREPVVACMNRQMIPFGTPWMERHSPTLPTMASLVGASGQAGMLSRRAVSQ